MKKVEDLEIQIGDLVIERRLRTSRPFHQRLSMVLALRVSASYSEIRKVKVQSLTTGGIYWLYYKDVEVIK